MGGRERFSGMGFADSLLYHLVLASLQQIDILGESSYTALSEEFSYLSLSSACARGEHGEKTLLSTRDSAVA